MNIRKKPDLIQVVEDERFVRDLVGQFLGTLVPGVDVELFDNAEAARSRWAVRAPDLLVVDVFLGSANGVELGTELVRRFPESHVLLISGKRNESVIQDALQYGLHGFVSKNAPLDVFGQAIKTILEGGVFFSSGPGGTSRPAPEAGELSPREDEVLKLIATGKTNKEMGLDLGISSRTVEKHRENIMRKTGIRDVASLTRYAIKRGLVSDDA